MNEPYNLNSLWALNDHSKFIGQSRATDKAWSERYCKKAVLMEMNPMVMVKLYENRRKDYYLKTKAKNNTARIMSGKWKKIISESKRVQGMGYMAKEFLIFFLSLTYCILLSKEICLFKSLIRYFTSLVDRLQ